MDHWGSVVVAIAAANCTQVDEIGVVQLEVTVVVATVVSEVHELRTLRANRCSERVVRVDSPRVWVSDIQVGPLIVVESCPNHGRAVEARTSCRSVVVWRIDLNRYVLHVAGRRRKVAVLGYLGAASGYAVCSLVSVPRSAGRQVTEARCEHIVAGGRPAVTDSRVEVVDQWNRI